MNKSTVSSTPILRGTLMWSAAAAAVLALIAAGVGFAVAGTNGLWSGLIGVLLSLLFLGITAASILFANRWFGDPLYVPIFFGIVLGGWLVKLGVFIVLMIVLRGQPWVAPQVFFISIVAGVIFSLVVDALVVMRMRLPNVSDVELPTQAPDEDAS
jgi:hypothetical protein